jgi:hypothetical protein
MFLLSDISFCLNPQTQILLDSVRHSGIQQIKVPVLPLTTQRSYALEGRSSMRILKFV